MPQQVAGRANSRESNDLGGKKGKHCRGSTLYREVGGDFMKGGGRLFQVQQVA